MIKESYRKQTNTVTRITLCCTHFQCQKPGRFSNPAWSFAAMAFFARFPF